jgi:hypothetical protein
VLLHWASLLSLWCQNILPYQQPFRIVWCACCGSTESQWECSFTTVAGRDATVAGQRMRAQQHGKHHVKCYEDDATVAGQWIRVQQRHGKHHVTQQ